MELLTTELRNTLPPIGAQDNTEDPMVYVKYFCPWNNWTWYAYEFDGEDILFGFVKGDSYEFGTFSLSQMEAARGPMGQELERDTSFTPKCLSQCK